VRGLLTRARSQGLVARRQEQGAEAEFIPACSPLKVREVRGVMATEMVPGPLSLRRKDDMRDAERFCKLIMI